MQKLLKIKSITIDEELYPRSGWDWKTSYDYCQCMKSGSVFPPIKVGIYRGKYVLVGGKHRIEAYKMKKEEYIQAEIKKYTNKKDMFIDAVKDNHLHGRRFSTVDKTKIILKLQDLRCDKATISNLVHIPARDINSFTAKRVTSSISGKEIALKAPVRHFSNQIVDDNFEGMQQQFSVSSQTSLINELLSMLRGGLIDFSNPSVVNGLNNLKEILLGIEVNGKVEKKKRKVVKKKKTTKRKIKRKKS